MFSRISKQTGSLNRQHLAAYWANRLAMLRSTFSMQMGCVSAVMIMVSISVGSLAQAQTTAEHAAQRRIMVERFVKAAGVTNERVLQAMLDVPRHEFMPKEVQQYAYLDAGIPIGEKQTISSPFIVAYMTESLDPQPTDKVLEIGTGSGYQAAVLSGLVDKVYTIEIVEPLGRRAQRTLSRLKYNNVEVKVGDGFLGWPEKAPFDKIIVTCSPEDIPIPLVDQLKEGGLIVVPLGERHQQTLYLMRKKDGEMVREALHPTLFVPMTGKAEDQRQILPDGSNPRLLNPSFEEEPDQSGTMPGWYYQRQLTREQEVLAPHGEYFVTFSNEVPGHAAHLMQGLAIDGRTVSNIVMSASFKCDNVRAGLNPSDLPAISIMFFDENRENLGTAFIGPFQGTRAWQNYDREIRVPEGAREAIVRIGLFGALGSASFDNVSVRKKN
ncbi:MAG TPA: protein-L-isoaspartate(D-aspartate) O-methyltransferase [Pirellulaceae bacterium]|nr:protein-L-isoaspartate(D-aspartate) O-methyltransferase [Pirellulaceae bacterium]HMO93044.1 protein-L-isoaspartate(D-aspartate) O-methyltransferase [Pirellulaceae bacterium]HMP69674.1 protein-L-isoaspartate(D-aspartate) O-methyltransferase [Pirellulaceae bacterium]